MKALTIWQPWASLIMAGAKPFEFRGWRAPRSIIGQRIVIHAAARKMDRQDVDMMLFILLNREKCDQFAQSAAETCLIPDCAIPVLQKACSEGLPMACGLGTAVARITAAIEETAKGGQS